MHQRGTHCGRSDGKNQINRAQSRWNNETARDEAEESVEETIAGELAGNVQASCLGMTAVKSREALTGTGAAGSGIASGADCSMQQQAFVAVPQPQPTGVAGESVWADAIT